jgi:hypothetical protein
MSSGTNAHPARAGFNQSGGAYFVCLASLDTNTGAAAGLAGSVGGASYVTALVNAGSNSGGAFVNPTLSTVTMTSIIGAGTTTGNAQSVVGSGKLLKDMGKTVVSAGRTFRKFAPVVAGLGVSSFGTVGGPAVGANSGYGSFYLEVGREAFGPTPVANTTLGPAPIARYF